MELYTLLSHVFMVWCLVWLRLILTLFFHLRHFLSNNLNSSQIICLPKFRIILIPLVSVRLSHSGTVFYPLFEYFRNIPDSEYLPYAFFQFLLKAANLINNTGLTLTVMYKYRCNLIQLNFICGYCHCRLNFDRLPVQIHMLPLQTLLHVDTILLETLSTISKYRWSVLIVDVCT
jgi:hypothetical protein